MNWGVVRNGRLLAGLYLAAFTSACIGILWLLVLQWTARAGTILVATILFVAGGLTIIALAVALRDQAPAPKSRLTHNTTGYQRIYHRLALGMELRGAWRAVRR